MMNSFLFCATACVFNLLVIFSPAQPSFVTYQDLTETPIPYDSLLHVINGERMAFRQAFFDASGTAMQDSVLRDASSYLHRVLVNELFPHWYGTPWDFNGISEVPGQGQIACGYFISTTLKQAGFRLNRYRMAQSDATTIIRTLCDTPVTRHRKDSAMAYLYRQPDGLFVLGLDYHVTYVNKQGNDLAVVHSSYLDPVAVVREPWEQSAVLDASRIFVMGKLSAHPSLVQDWLLGNRVWPE